ncbi:MAG: RNA polymerase sigma factor [Pseudonocardiaceae bacterium]
MTDPSSEGAKSERDEAVAALFKDHRSEIIKFARGRGADDPVDTTDEAFLQLLTNWDHLHHTNKALPWMRTVVRRLTCKQFRNLERQRDLVRLLGLDLTATQVEFDLVLNEDQRAVFDAVLALSHQQCVIIVLQFWYELSITEIAQELGIQEKTVRTHNRRAIVKLRKSLGALR